MGASRLDRHGAARLAVTVEGAAWGRVPAGSHQRFFLVMARAVRPAAIHASVPWAQAAWTATALRASR